jgi:glycosyltransferase involved in cell wall biosynthesis
MPDNDRIVDRDESARLIEKRYGISLKNKKVILSVSRLVPKKGIEKFIENVFPILDKKAPDSVFLVAGDGPEKAGILKTINQLGLGNKIFLIGNIEHGSVLYKALFSMSDVFIMPNVRVADDFEGFGVVILEAGINGTPVVAYDIDGISEALHDKQNGVLVKEGDTQRFAEAALLFLNDSNLRQRFSAQALEYVKHKFDWAGIVGIYMDEYRKLLGRITVNE